MSNKAWKEFSESNESAFNQVAGQDDDCVYYDYWGSIGSGNLKKMKKFP